MFATVETENTYNVTDEPQLTVVQTPQLSDEEKAERRRRFYERIAQGNALAEVEDQARRPWSRK